MKLVDEGKLNLDKPLIRYLSTPYPEVHDARINQVTARQVLSHTSGFPNWRNSDTLKIFFNPGERFSYSGSFLAIEGKGVPKFCYSLAWGQWAPG